MWVKQELKEIKAMSYTVNEFLLEKAYGVLYVPWGYNFSSMNPKWPEGNLSHDPFNGVVKSQVSMRSLGGSHFSEPPQTFMLKHFSTNSNMFDDNYFVTRQGQVPRYWIWLKCCRLRFLCWNFDQVSFPRSR